MITELLLTAILGISEAEVPQHLYKIVSPEAWEESVQNKALSLGPNDQQFIHLSTEEQIPHVAGKFFKGKKYVILTIDPKKLKGRLVYETNPGGTHKYYHLYDGAIPMNAIEKVKK